MYLSHTIPYKTHLYLHCANLEKDNTQHAGTLTLTHRNTAKTDTNTPTLVVTLRLNTEQLFSVGPFLLLL